MRAIYLLPLCFVLLIGCHKPDPHPELQDPIYKDLEAKKKDAETRLEAEKKMLEEAQAEMKKAVPQTGQIKFAQKHYFESRARLEKIQQEIKFYSLRLKSRTEEAQASYLEAFEKEKPWPDPQEYEDYQVRESARTKSRNWSVKNRIQSELGSSGAAAPEKKKGH